MSLADQRAQYMPNPVSEIHNLNTHPGNAEWRVSYMHIVSNMHTGNTNIGITPTSVSRLYAQPPNKQLPRVIIINILQIIFYYSTLITCIF
jgi:hypothetical protein